MMTTTPTAMSRLDHVQYGPEGAAATVDLAIGPMAMVGSIRNGLTLDAQTLVLRSSLDGIAAVALAGDSST